MKTKLCSMLYLAFVLITTLLLTSCSNGLYSREEYQETLVDWPYSVLVAYRDPTYSKDDADIWNEFHKHFHNLLHEEQIEYIESIKGSVVIYVKNEDCQRAMTIINRYVNARELRVVPSWDDMVKMDYFPRIQYVPLEPGITFGYNTQGKGHACSAPDQ